ncbi:Peptidoglycan-binding LysM domain protein [Quillaja saponaria]|uniref:Peptidoglycan-binding LysM domain protein n=1 Tax=Quillaja saponaria TaxID=32244 RepID=A0AAD7VDG2_QUISA|nr:Peptidoglycan-binding LysM domain protein [Quillaja saponaria]
MACECSSTAMAEKISWYCSLFLVVLLVLSCCESSTSDFGTVRMLHKNMNNNNRPCDEIYVVREGETLQTISEKCGDPYIVEENPHIHDPDDVFPGLVIKITPFVTNIN